MSDENRQSLVDAAESKTLRMRENSLHGNRETLETPLQNPCRRRSEKANGQTSDMHVSRESDDSIVPKKRANKAGSTAAAESVEERGSTKGNATRYLTRAGRSAGAARHGIVGRTRSSEAGYPFPEERLLVINPR